jgi:hypothetical protein
MRIGLSIEGDISISGICLLIHCARSYQYLKISKVEMLPSSLSFFPLCSISILYPTSVLTGFGSGRMTTPPLSPPFSDSAPSPHKHLHHRHCFSPKEDEQLRMVVDQIGTRRWDIVASFLPFRTPRQCRDRYKNYLLDFLVAVPWTPAEDEIVRREYAEIGPKWVEISKLLTGRSGNDVKNRWHKHIAKGKARSAAGTAEHGA